jgi:hypothetical protein
MDVYNGEKSTINLLSADEEIIEKWMISQVSNQLGLVTI